MTKAADAPRAGSRGRLAEFSPSRSSPTLKSTSQMTGELIEEQGRHSAWDFAVRDRAPNRSDRRFGGPSVGAGTTR